MKKKKIAASKKTTNVRSSRVSKKPISIVWQRFVVMGAGVALVLLILVPNRHIVTQSVEGVSILKGLYNQATITIPQVSNAVKYNIYYRQTTDNGFTHAVRNLPPGITKYTISYLKRNASYQYRISAVNAFGAEFWWSPTFDITNATSM